MFDNTAIILLCDCKITRVHGDFSALISNINTMQFTNRTMTLLLDYVGKSNCLEHQCSIFTVVFGNIDAMRVLHFYFSFM